MSTNPAAASPAGPADTSPPTPQPAGREPQGGAAGLPPWFVKGDVDGFFGLALDNLIQVLVIVALCGGVLGFGPALLYGRVLPGVAISLVIGNLYYAWQARRLMLATGRRDVCALPYGINTVSLFAYVFLVMLPVKVGALAAGASEEQAAQRAFAAGIAAALGSGLIEAGGSWLVGWLRRWTPRAALLSTLAGIAVTFISAGFLFKTFASPLVAFLPLGAVLLTYFGRVRFPLGLPGGLVALALGVTLAWLTPFRSWDPQAWTQALGLLGLHLPTPTLGALWAGLAEGDLLTYLAIILPMGLFNLVGSLQNLESAAATGDHYPTTPSLLANGAGTLLGACFGCPFPTTIYIGHPGWKALGARAGYSVLNAAFFTALAASGGAALIGYLVPIEAGMAIVLWIGIIIVAQAFSATPREHAPAVALGLLPGIAGWGAMLLKAGGRAAGMGTPAAPFGPGFSERLGLADIAGHGVFALEQGFLLTAMLWAALAVEVIERRFARAAAWAAAGAALSLLGLAHSYRWLPTDTLQDLRPGAGWEWAVGYALLALLLLCGRWLRREQGGGHA